MGRQICKLYWRNKIYLWKKQNEVRNELKNVIYDYNATNHQEIRGDITLNLWFKHYIKIKQQMIK